MQASPPANPILARVWRGSAAESFHRGAVAVVLHGRVVYSAGDIATPRFLRSAAKPFQAMPAVGAILESGFDLSDPELAVITASHAGQPRHVEIVQRLLLRAGLDPEVLRCGAHPPFHGATARDLVRQGRAASVFHNNCSGKHAAMVLASSVRGLPLETYLDPAHPIQAANRATLAEFAGVTPETIGVEIDGCSAPTFVLPLERAAVAFARFTTHEPTHRLAEPWRRLLDAIRAEPLAYSGEGLTDAKLIDATRGLIIPKVGAEGFYAFGVVGAELGFAFKMDDGSHRATEALAAELLLRFAPKLPADVLANLQTWRDCPITNAAGLRVGRIETILP